MAKFIKLPPGEDPRKIPSSLWSETACPQIDLDQLKGLEETDIAVIGGGYTGLSAALHLAEEGGSIAVLDAAFPGWGASGRNGGQVVAVLKWNPDEVINKLGPVMGQRLIQMADTGPRLVFNIIKHYGIDCQPAQKGWLMGVHKHSAKPRIDRLVKSWKKQGADIEFLDGDQARTMIGSPLYCAGIWDHRGGVVQPLSYARGLANSACQVGAKVYANSPVIKIAKKGSDWLLETPSGNLIARTIIIATNGYTSPVFNQYAPGLHHSYIGATSCVIATEPLPPTIRSTILPGGQSMANSKRVLTYCRLDEKGRLVVGGRGKFKGQDSLSAYRAVEKSMRHIFPQINAIPISHRWYGRICLTPDQLPHLYQAESGIFVALGYNGKGIAMATSFGKEIAKQILEPSDKNLLVTSSLPPIPHYWAHRLGVSAISSYYRLLDLFG